MIIAAPDRIAFDSSGFHPTVDQCRRVGVDKLLFYLGGPSDWRTPTVAHVAGYLDAGFSLAPISEHGNGSDLLDPTAGLAASDDANRAADRFGIPGDCPIRYALDVDAPNLGAPGFQQADDAMAAFLTRAAGGARRPAWTYNEADHIDALVGRGAQPALSGWQSGARSFSGFRYALNAGIVQLASNERNTSTREIPLNSVDENVIFHLLGFYTHAGTIHPDTPLDHEDWLAMATLQEVSDLVDGIVTKRLGEKDSRDKATLTAMHAEDLALLNRIVAPAEKGYNGIVGLVKHAGGLDELLTGGAITPPVPAIVA